MYCGLPLFGSHRSRFDSSFDVLDDEDLQFYGGIPKKLLLGSHIVGAFLEEAFLALLALSHIFLYSISYG